jgi:uncharacterized membrane protein
MNELQNGYQLLRQFNPWKSWETQKMQRQQDRRRCTVFFVLANG